LQEIFNQFDVILTRVPASHINELNVVGVIFVIKKQESYCIEWKPNQNVEIAGAEIGEVVTGDAGDEWSIINQITFKPAVNSVSFLSPKVKNLRLPLGDVRKVKVHDSELMLYNRSDEHVVTYMFKKSSPSSFLRALINQRLLKQSPHDRNVYLIKDPEFEKLQRSFAELNIEEIKTSKAQRPFLLSHGYELFSKLAAVPQTVLGARNERYEDRPGAYRFDMESDSVTSAVAAAINGGNEECDNKMNGEKQDAVKKEDSLPPRTIRKRENPLTVKQWQEFRTEDGRISDPERIREIIFRGGIESSIRPEVWRYLLNYDCWEHTATEREVRREDLHEEYYRMKQQWTTLSKIQERNFSGYRDRKCQIEKDVKRTDRNMEYYNGDDNPNVERLQEILLTYCMYNFDVGYVQGMSDLLSIILFVIEDEAQSFWCFVGFMEKVFRNFDEDQAGMKNQLGKMRTLMEFANPPLFRYFKEHDSDNMYFCFRWLLVWYKREFTHDDILELWEVLWTSLPCADFHLLIGVAILDNERETFIDNEYGFTEILKHVNDLSEKMDLRRILETAEAIYHQIIGSSKLPDRVRVVLGMEPVNSYGDDPYNSEDEEQAQLVRERKLRAQEAEDASVEIERSCDSALESNYF